MRSYTSWGNYPTAQHQEVRRILWRHHDLPPRADGSTLLPYGLGRSYGDACLNDGGTLIDTSPLNHFIAFDGGSGLLRCEAGVPLAAILELVVPRGWFLPVTPGTKHVTLGGAIANDIHGKNHHRAGTFGRHVRRFELLRSDGQRLVCTPDENEPLFRATIGGLGLTGLVTWAEFQLKRIESEFIDREALRVGGLEAFFELAEESDRHFEYTVAWIDCLAKGRGLGRGRFFRGNHAPATAAAGRARRPRGPIEVPCYAPEFLLSPPTLRLFNSAYFHRQVLRLERRPVPWSAFFFPLDSVGHWSRLYGRRGLLQYQCVVPHAGGREAIHGLLEQVAASGQGSFLAVLKVFGELTSPGILSFPRPGITLALDFPHRGRPTLELLDRLDAIVLEHAGRVYPAKDARMSAASFQAYFPEWRELARHVDPAFSSSFWRRVTMTGEANA